MMKTIKKLVLLFLLPVVFNCSKDSSDTPVKEMEVIIPPKDDPAKSSAKELTDFAVTSSNNPNLKIDADVQRSGTNLNLFFPFATDIGDLKVSFTVSDKAKLKLDGAELVSGSTAIDFSSNPSLTVEAEDGSTQDYSLTAETNFESLDAAMQQVMSDNNAPSMQLAITKGKN